MNHSSNITRIPLTRVRATEIVREIAKESQRWMITMTYSQNQIWRELVNRRQIQLCLSEGYVLEHTADMDQSTAVKLGVQALLEVVDSGAKNMEICIVTQGGTAVLEEKDVDLVVKGIEAEIEEGKLAKAAKSGE